MRSAAPKATDWTDAAAYRPLLDAERAIFAWEWLRRDPRYRSDAAHALAGSGSAPPPERWGLHAYEDPERTAPEARPVWTARAHARVLAARADAAQAAADAFDLARFASLATIVAGRGGSEHLLISDGLRTVRVDIVAGSVRRGPAQLEYLLAGLASAGPPLLALRRLLALDRSGRLSATLHPPERRAKRWTLALRAHDALAAGAAQREIAALLVGAAAEAPRWRSRAPSLRSQAQRLVRGARRMATGGYLALLR